MRNKVVIKGLITILAETTSQAFSSASHACAVFADIEWEAWYVGKRKQRHGWRHWTFEDHVAKTNKQLDCCQPRERGFEEIKRRSFERLQSPQIRSGSTVTWLERNQNRDWTFEGMQKKSFARTSKIQDEFWWWPIVRCSN